MDQEQFQKFVDGVGSLAVLSSLAGYFENDTEVSEDWEKDYLIHEASRLLEAVKALPVK